MSEGRAAKSIPAASICLVHRDSRSILMGKRLVGAWPDYWAFPGGKIEAGETAEQAAVRELLEETSIDLKALVPLSIALTTEVHVEFGERAFAITNLAVFVSERLAGEVSVELEPRWIEIDRVSELSPIARGTQTVVDRVAALLLR